MSWLSSAVNWVTGRSHASDEASKNRAFQERMRNTAWQAGVADMEKAGLNPALAYSKGPAASPGGSMANISTETPVSAAKQLARFREDIKLVRSQAREAAAKASVAEDERWWSGQRREYFDRTKGPGLKVEGGPSLGQIKADRLYQLLDSELGLKLAQTSREQAMATITGTAGSVAGDVRQFLPALGRITGTASRGADKVADVVELLERVGGMRDQAVRAYFGLPKKAVLRLLEEMKRFKR